MRYTKLRPMLRSEKFDETIDFYTNVLGFRVGNRDDERGWASLYKDNLELMLAKPTEHTPFDKPVFTGSFYFNTDNVNKLWEELKEKAKICYEIENFDWQMREFAIYDNNGYVLQFGQDLTEIKK